MKVKCLDKKKPNQETEYSNLTIGREYIVLALEFYDSKLPFCNAVGDFVVYRILGNDGIVMPYPAKIFEITSEIIPSIWVTFRKPGGMYSILPRNWARDYFWDDFYNDEYQAVEEFKKEVERINIEVN